MSVELKERKWSGMLEIEKVSVEGCWIIFTIVHGLRVSIIVSEKLIVPKTIVTNLKKKLKKRD